MTVDELRETLIQLGRLLQAADAKKGTVSGLAEFVELAAPFGPLSLKAFVKLAEAGQKPPADRPPGQGRGGAAPKADADALARDLAALYERAGGLEVSEEQLRAACAPLGGLTKDGLVRVADAVGLVGMKAKAKGDIADAITARLLGRKGAATRRELIDRPPAPPAGEAPARTAGW